MKTFVAAILIGASCCLLAQGQMTAQQKAQLETFHKSCLSSSGATQQQVEEIKNGKFPNDQKLRKYTFCMMNNFGIVSKTGQINVDAIRAQTGSTIAKKDAAQIIAKCANIKGANPEEVGYLFYQCYFKNSENSAKLGE